MVALGFTLVLGTLDLMNFAHGETIMAGAFAALVSLTMLALPLVLAFRVSVLVGALVAFVVYLVSIRYVNKTYWAAPALSAVGAGLLLQTSATRLFGTHQREVPDPLRSVQIDLGGVVASTSQGLIIASRS